MASWLAEFGRRLSEARQASGLTQAEVAEAMARVRPSRKIKPDAARRGTQTVQRIERGESVNLRLIDAYLQAVRAEADCRVTSKIPVAQQKVRAGVKAVPDGADESDRPPDLLKVEAPSMTQDDAAAARATKAITGILDSFANYPSDLREQFIKRADALAYEMKRTWNEQQDLLGKTADQADG